MNASRSVSPQHIDFLGFCPDGYSLSGGHILTAYKSSGKWGLWIHEGRGGKEGRQARALEKVNREEQMERGEKEVMKDSEHSFGDTGQRRGW